MFTHRFTGHTTVQVTALLRWASPPDDTGMPVVKCDGPLLQLLARNPLEFVHRAVAEEDAQSGGGPISAAVGGAPPFPLPILCSFQLLSRLPAGDRSPTRLPLLLNVSAADCYCFAESIAFLYTKGAALAGKGGAAPRHGAVDVYLTREASASAAGAPFARTFSLCFALPPAARLCENASPTPASHTRGV